MVLEVPGEGDEARPSHPGRVGERADHPMTLLMTLQVVLVAVVAAGAEAAGEREAVADHLAPDPQLLVRSPWIMIFSACYTVLDCLM